MDGFSKYCLLAFAVVTLSFPTGLAGQSQRSSTTKTDLGEGRSKRSAEAKGERSEESGKTFLHKDWQVQSSGDDKAGGDKISAVGCAVERWHRTDIPATVVGVLVTDKTYPDPDYGTNLKNF